MSDIKINKQNLLKILIKLQAHVVELDKGDVQFLWDHLEQVLCDLDENDFFGTEGWYRYFGFK